MVNISDMILDAYEAGAFCKCKPKKIVDKKTGIIQTIMLHDMPQCEALVKMSTLVERSNEVRPK